MDTFTSVLSLNISQYCQSLETEFPMISADRKEKLIQIRQYIAQKWVAQDTPKIIVICTHNSRRSHFGQLWLAVAASYYQLPKLLTFSGGTEATAFNPRAVAALQEIGFEINTSNSNIANPKYEIQWEINGQVHIAFSKKYDAPSNPNKEFAAIMVCTQADETCPLVTGSDFRVSLPFDDPKAFDESNLEAFKYAESCRQIGREMLFILHALV